MTPYTLVKLTTLSVSAIYGAVLYSVGLNLTQPYKEVLSFLPLLGTISLWVWDRYSLKIAFVREMTKRPRIDGLWRVELIPSEKSDIPQGGNRGPIEGFMQIRQTYWSVHISFYTQESYSTTLAFSWLKEPNDGEMILNYIYSYKPKAAVRHRSYPADGSGKFSMRDLRPKYMTGAYYTDRLTAGDVTAKYIAATTNLNSFELCENVARTKEANK